MWEYFKNLWFTVCRYLNSPPPFVEISNGMPTWFKTTSLADDVTIINHPPPNALHRRDTGGIHLHFLILHCSTVLTWVQFKGRGCTQPSYCKYSTVLVRPDHHRSQRCRTVSGHEVIATWSVVSLDMGPKSLGMGMFTGDDLTGSVLIVSQ